jgi:predicted O-linked N-acetylglucosamine transferase (SPINDLY family)
MVELSENLLNLIAIADKNREQGNWRQALDIYKNIETVQNQSAAIKHNKGLCYYGLGEFNSAIKSCSESIELLPSLWQSNIVIAKSLRQSGDIFKAEHYFNRVLAYDPNNGEALLGLADLAMNEFGDPIKAKLLVKPLQTDIAYSDDASLTFLMASLYDRDQTALEISQSLMAFSQKTLQLDASELLSYTPIHSIKNKRLRVGLMSPLFCASPVFFLTINFFKRIAERCDLIIFNRGTKNDWATEEFRKIAVSWFDIHSFNAVNIANQIKQQQIDVFYDLGGWMDPIGLSALSVKPAEKQYKWVGGQSVTTGLTCFDGWIGDNWQSPAQFRHLYSEPLINLNGDYAEYFPPAYLPKPARKKLNTYAIFANPAKVSTAFLVMIDKIPGKKCFIHRQYQYPSVRERIEKILNPLDVEYICPQSHQEALNAVNRFAIILDTFPYSSGLTAREVLSMRSKIQVLKVGELFCERHTAKYSSQ